LKRQSMQRSAKPFEGLRDPVLMGYVAGILDGEGTVHTPPHVALTVGSTTKALVVRLTEIVGGSVAGPYHYQKTKMFGSKRCVVKPQFRWNFSSRYHCYLLLKILFPYLVVKAKDAKRTIHYLEKSYGWKAK